MDLGKVLGTLTSFFEREGCRYAAVGEFGSMPMGWRGPLSTSIWPLKSAGQPKLVAFLESLGYETLYRSAGYSTTFTTCLISGASTLSTWTARRA